MSASITLHFYEDGPAPVPLTTIASAEVDLLHHRDRTATAENDIPINLRIAPAKLARVHHSPQPEKQDDTGSLSTSALDTASPPSDNESDSDGESSRSDLTEPGKIPKPSGEAGRPYSGGYNLERKLAWSKITFKQIKVSSVA